jgi:hypothetical protein
MLKSRAGRKADKSLTSLVVRTEKSNALFYYKRKADAKRRIHIDFIVVFFLSFGVGAFFATDFFI